MTEPLLRPRSASEILDAAFRVLRRHYTTFLVVSAIGYLPQLLVGLVQLSLLGADGGTIGEDATPNPFAFGFGGAVGIMILYAVFYSITEGMHVSLASSAYNTGRVDLGEAFARAKDRAPKLLGAAMLAGLAIAAGGIAFVVPGLYVFSRLATAVPTAVLDEPNRFDGLSPSEVLSRTWERSKGRAWHVFATFGLALVVYMAISFGIGLLAGAFSLFGGATIVLAFTAVLTILAYPLIPIVNTVLYYDLRIRAEGYDLEASVGALSTAGASSPDAPPVVGGELPPPPARIRIR